MITSNDTGNSVQRPGGFHRLRTTGEAILSLGLINVAAVAWHRMLLGTGVLKQFLPLGPGTARPLFSVHTEGQAPVSVFPFSRRALLTEADELLAGRFRPFFGKPCQVGSPPDWFRNPLLGRAIKPAVRKAHWTTIEEFSLESGDIKALWDCSRFGWVSVLARAYLLTGDAAYVDTLNAWAADWCERNPMNAGPHWRCGQEASLRLLNVLLGAALLDQLQRPNDALIEFVVGHCTRIRATLGYALAQDNNHGTSEATALLVGGAFVARCSGVDASIRGQGRRWEQRGRHWLENRVGRLIQPDGSFAQHSVIYHRFVLDTLSIAEHWRRRLSLPLFSPTFQERARAAVDWLFQMTDPQSGEAPNLGANDGSRFFCLCSSTYGDNRSSIQLAAVLFLGTRVYPGGVWDEPLYWLGHKPAESPSPPLRHTSRIFPDGGYVTLHSTNGVERSWAVVRFPRFRFRPSHADAMHLDLWANGRNVLRDGGSYSYADPEWNAYFSGTVSHNTVQFDGRDQMPRIGRFLFGKWLKPSYVGPLIEEGGTLSWMGEFRDCAGARHRRTISVVGGLWRITDDVEGHEYEAVLRWRLIPADWRLEGSVCFSSVGSLRVEADVPVRRLALVRASESRKYMERTEIPCLELAVGPGRALLETRINLGR